MSNPKPTKSQLKKLEAAATTPLRKEFYQAILKHGLDRFVVQQNISRPGSNFWRNWKVYLDLAGISDPEPPTPSLKPEAPPEPKHLVEIQKLKDQVQSMRLQVRDVRRFAGSQEDFRKQIFGLGKPYQPANYKININKSLGDSEIPLLFTSDFQWGEVIRGEEVGDLNIYNNFVAKARYRRLIESTIRCALLDAQGKPIPCLYYLRGGDAISGGIHEELAETNDLSSIPAVQDLAQMEIWGLRTLAEKLGCQIHVISVPGNHDRTTKRPRFKGYNEHSFDTVISWHMEMTLGQESDIKFISPKQSDALFKIYDRQFLLTHGDQMGVGGGTGYIGPIAAISKGHRKLVDQYAQEQVPIDYVLTGHFHTAVETEYGWGNGCLPGYGEYARGKIRAKPAAPVQWLLQVNPKRGVTTRRQIMVGGKGEGKMCDMALGIR